MREDHEGQNETQNETLVYAADVFIYAACASTSKNKLFIVYNIYTSIRKFRIALVASYG